MAQNVTIAGASYPDVPSVVLPKTGGGTAQFTDVSATTAVDSDVASGKVYFKADGTQSTGTATGGGGSAIVVTDTTDVHGGTIREITAVDLSSDTVDSAHLLYGYTAHDRTGTAITGSYTAPVLVSKTITANDTYDPADDDADGYSQVTVNVPQGIVVPTGYKYYNGYLLPDLPVVTGYDYFFIRMNNSTGNYDLVAGKSQWRVNTASTLDAWQIQFATITTDGAMQYSVPQNGTTTTATTWGTATVSTSSYYGTSGDRKLIWSSHDITIGTTANVMYKRGYPLG